MLGHIKSHTGFNTYQSIDEILQKMNVTLGDQTLNYCALRIYVKYVCSLILQNQTTGTDMVPTEQ